MLSSPFVVLVTGHPAAGKTTNAPLLADELGAVAVSRELISILLFEGWEPVHPALAEGGYTAPIVAGSTFHEGKVSWNIFTLTIEQVVAGGAPVVAETPVNHEFARARLLALRDKLRVPFVEVHLRADLRVLRQRIRTRAVAPDAHAIQAHFTVAAAEPLLETEFVPLLDDEHVVTVDATDLTAIDIPVIAAQVRQRLDEP